MIRRMIAALLPISLLSSSGCAWLVNGTTQRVRVETRPPHATVRLLPEDLRVETPIEMKLDRSKVYTLLVELEGHCPEMVEIDRVTSWAVYLNAPLVPILLLQPPIGASVAAFASKAETRGGGVFELTPDDIEVELAPAGPEGCPP